MERTRLQRILILGATSAIAEHTARLWASRGARLYLVGRNERRLSAIAADLEVRGADRVGRETLDLCAVGEHEAMLARARAFLGGLDVALLAHGTLSDPERCLRDCRTALAELSTNALSVIALSIPIAQAFASQGHGTLAVISSVAGDRGRAVHPVYGAAKAAVTAFLSGLRQRLHPQVRVVTIKPGFVDTPMTAHLPKGFLWANPERVARDIVRAIDRGTPVIYTPWFWRFLLAAVRAIPERMFVRLRF
jgi:short-subunit dehydrogenase